MPRYVEILAVQRPFPFDVDENDRTMFSVNFTALAEAPVATFEHDLVAILSGEGLATLGADTFVGAKYPANDGGGPFVHVIDTGGTAPDETQNGDRYERLSAQIVVRAAKFTDGRDRALAIWRALDGKRHVTV